MASTAVKGEPSWHQSPINSHQYLLALSGILPGLSQVQVQTVLFKTTSTIQMIMSSTIPQAMGQVSPRSLPLTLRPLFPHSPPSLSIKKNNEKNQQIILSVVRVSKSHLPNTSHILQKFSQPSYDVFTLTVKNQTIKTQYEAALS